MVKMVEWYIIIMDFITGCKIMAVHACKYIVYNNCRIVGVQDGGNKWQGNSAQNVTIDMH